MTEEKLESIFAEFEKSNKENDKNINSEKSKKILEELGYVMNNVTTIPDNQDYILCNVEGELSKLLHQVMQDKISIAQCKLKFTLLCESRLITMLQNDYGAHNQEIIKTLCDSNNRVILISGKSGSGKTFTIEKFAQYTGKHYCVVDASSATPEGYRGETLKQKMLDSIQRSINSLEDIHNIKETGIVVLLDEIDKSFSDTKKENSFGTQLQGQILKFLEDDVSFTLNQKQYTIPAEKIKICMAGSFSNKEIKSKRDLAAQGFTQELLSRIDKVCSTEDLTKEQEIARIAKILFDEVVALQLEDYLSEDDCVKCATDFREIITKKKYSNFREISKFAKLYIKELCQSDEIAYPPEDVSLKLEQYFNDNALFYLTPPPEQSYMDYMPNQIPWYHVIIAVSPALGKLIGTLLGDACST